jgi:hypothetical protein
MASIEDPEILDQPRAISANYDAVRGRIVVLMSSGLELAFDPRAAEGLEHASATQLAHIEISPAGDGLHWPEVDADLFVPALLEGKFGSTAWMNRRNKSAERPGR